MSEDLRSRCRKIAMKSPTRIAMQSLCALAVCTTLQAASVEAEGSCAQQSP